MLFQYEQFFREHSDPDVRQRGEFLLAIIAGLRGAASDGAVRLEDPLMSDSVTRWEAAQGRLVYNWLSRCGWSKGEAAQWLGISRQCLHNWVHRLEAWGIIVPSRAQMLQPNLQING